MKTNWFIAIVAAFVVAAASCKSKSQRDAQKYMDEIQKTMKENPAKTNDKQEPNNSSNSSSQAGDIVGEWEQQYTCFDKNGNYKLEPDEKKPSNTRLGFNWFRFNADGSCLRDKDVQFKESYTIQEKNGNKKLMLEGGDNLRYTIIDLTEKELILGSDGAFIVFKRIK